MEFVRKVVNGTDLKDVVDIPDSFVNKKVEILVFPIEEQVRKSKKKKSLSGFLAQYAKPDLMEKEENVWIKEAEE